MEKLENLLESWILHTSQLQYSVDIQASNEGVTMNMRYEESPICSRPGHGQSLDVIKV